MTKFLESLKAVSALIGSVITAVLGTQAPGSTLFLALTIAAAVLTGIATYQIPNQPPSEGF